MKANILNINQHETSNHSNQINNLNHINIMNTNTKHSSNQISRLRHQSLNTTYNISLQVF